MTARTNRISWATKSSRGGGMSYYFTVVAHRMVRAGGTIALLLPSTALISANATGADTGWQHFRHNLIRNYHDVRIVSIAQYADRDSSFSHDTNIAEVMVIANRNRPGTPPAQAGHFINLARGPGDPEDAGRLARAIAQVISEMKQDPGRTQILPLTLEGQQVGTVLQTPLPSHEPWPLARVLDPTLLQAANDLQKGRVAPAQNSPGNPIPMTTLEDLGTLCPAQYEMESAFDHDARARTGRGFPFLSGHDSPTQRSIVTPTTHRIAAKKGKESRVDRFWTRGSSWFHLNDNFRYNSQSTSACITNIKSIGGRGWVTIRMKDKRHEKATALWMNTTLGLICHWARTNHTQNGLGYASRFQVRTMQTLNTRALSEDQLNAIERTFDQWAGTPFLPANEAWRGPPTHRARQPGAPGHTQRRREHHRRGNVPEKPVVPGAHRSGTQGKGQETPG